MPTFTDTAGLAHRTIFSVCEYAAQNLETAIKFFDCDGLAITNPSPTHHFFNVLMKSEAGREHLHNARENLAAKALGNGQPHLDVCPFTGLLQACVPAKAEGKPLGYWMIGQTLLPENERSYEYYEQYLHEISLIIHLHRYPLRKLMWELPVVPQAEFIKAVHRVDAATREALEMLAPPRAVALPHIAPPVAIQPAS